MSYNLTNLSAANTPLEIFQEMNTLTDDWLIRVFLIGLWGLVVIGVSHRTGEPVKGMVAASFLTSIISVLFYGANLTSGVEPLMSLLSLAAFSIILYLGDTPG